MVMDVIAATKLRDLLTPQGRGERVNSHVVNSRREPKPDFDAMKKVIQGGSSEKAPSLDQRKREIPRNS
jgi:hypothetical protein